MSYFKTFLMMGSALALAACGADDVASPGEGSFVGGGTPTPTPPSGGTPTPTPTPPSTGPAADCPTGTSNVGVINNLRNCQLSGTVTGNLTLRNLRGVIYSLSGRVAVGNDVGGDGAKAGGAQGILTIDPGTVIFGSSGADFLLVNRGSQIFAEGTATNPIIFTSRQNVEGTATADSIGQWGGIVILGRAPISDCIGQGVAGGTVGCEGNVEGVNGGLYGGATPADNSGRLRYVQVRYPGFEVSTGNELNGITLAGVGSGTTIDFVQIHNSSDDGIEWFGGRVNHKNIVVTGADDDSLDVDIGWKGFIQTALVLQRTTGGDRIIEGDSPGNVNSVPRTNPRISNATFVSRRSADAILLRGGMDLTLVNSVVSSTAICLDIDEAATVQAADATMDEAGAPVFRSVLFSCPTNVARDEADVAAASITPLTQGNGNLTAAATLTGDFINGTAESGVTPFNATTLNSFFSTTTYIGAVRDAQDTWYQGWTCGVGASAPACTAVPANTGS